MRLAFLFMAVLLSGCSRREADPVARDRTIVEEGTPLHETTKKSVGCGVPSEYGRKLFQALLGSTMDQNRPFGGTHLPPAAILALMRSVPAEQSALYARYKAARAQVETLFPDRFVKKEQADSMMIGWDLAGEYLKPGYDLRSTSCSFRLRFAEAGFIPDIGAETVRYPEMAVPGHRDTRGRLEIYSGYFCGSDDCKWHSSILSIVDKKPYAEYTSNWSLTQDWGWPQKELNLPGWKK